MNTPLPEQGRPDTAGGSAPEVYEVRPWQELLNGVTYTVETDGDYETTTVVPLSGAPIIPDGYPFFDTDSRARCGWLGHGKATVRTVVHDGVLIERYDCRCGKFYWLSQQNGERPIVRYRS